MLSCLFCIMLTLWYLITKEVNPFPALMVFMILKAFSVDSIQKLFNMRPMAQLFKNNTVLFNLDEILLRVLFILSCFIFLGVQAFPYYLILTLFVYRTALLSMNKSIRRIGNK